LRHSFASHLAMRGVLLKVVQLLLGHATMDMTMRYAHLSPNIPREAVKALDAGAVAPTWHRRSNLSDNAGQVAVSKEEKRVEAPGVESSRATRSRSVSIGFARFLLRWRSTRP
jgi:Phage integrase family